MLIQKNDKEAIRVTPFALSSYVFWAVWKDSGDILEGCVTETSMLNITFVKSNADLSELYVPS